MPRVCHVHLQLLHCMHTKRNDYNKMLYQQLQSLSGSVQYPRPILSVPHAGCFHALPMLVKEAPALQNLWHPQGHSSHR